MIEHRSPGLSLTLHSIIKSMMKPIFQVPPECGRLEVIMQTGFVRGSGRRKVVTGQRSKSNKSSVFSLTAETQFLSERDDFGRIFGDRNINLALARRANARRDRGLDVEREVKLFQRREREREPHVDEQSCQDQGKKNRARGINRLVWRPDDAMGSLLRTPLITQLCKGGGPSH
jgi:hypothetical protein